MIEVFPSGSHTLISLKTDSERSAKTLYTPLYLFSENSDICAWIIYLHDNNTSVEITKTDIKEAASILLSRCYDFGIYGVSKPLGNLFVEALPANKALQRLQTSGGRSIPVNKDGGLGPVTHNGNGWNSSDDHDHRYAIRHASSSGTVLKGRT